MISVCSINPQIKQSFVFLPSHKSPLPNPFSKASPHLPSLLTFSSTRTHFAFTSNSSTTMAAAEPSQVTTAATAPSSSMKLLFVEMGVGYDQHGQDITSAAMRACRDAISSNSIPAFRRGSIPGVTFDGMKLEIKLGVPRSLQHMLDIVKVKSVFPYGKITNIEVVDGGLICSSGVHVEEMGDKNDDCYIVNAAVYVGY
ncbi:unnamed protein product [Cuscuta campestris]|uniref:50S ribosomal protein L34 n=1 Tax=Cuscuta campestris TaxID=132261 RepID=A0A484MJD5_9ASTE|nr:unnamed protein product [Cuscuta campestris]